ncbi:MAG: hypothetical protein HXY20_07975 [Acidobacteria bacterium]|nr:hypothetical protein [Acidobacteriota bacterium]
MDFDAIRNAIRNLSAEDRARLIAELGPELCRAAVQAPGFMERMMPQCEEMMRDPELQKLMRPMFQRMMERMMGGGKQNG